MGMLHIYIGKSGYLQQAQKLFDQFWPRPNFFPLNNQPFFDWQYRNNPFLPDDLEEGSIVAVLDDQVVGYIGLIPVPFHVYGEVIIGAYLTNWLVHPDFRAQGVGFYLLRKAMSKFPLIVGTAVSEAARNIYRALGARYLNDIPRWIGVFDPVQASELCVANNEKVKRSVLEFRTIRFNKHQRINYQVVEGPFGKQMDNLWNRLIERIGVASTRNQTYMNWRYFHHPNFTYRTIVVERSGQWQGVAVVRIEQVRDRSEKVMRILEFLADDDAQLTLASAIVQEAITEGCAYADFHGLSESWVRGLVAIGFFQHLEEPDLGVPYLFQPLEHRPRQNFVAWSKLTCKYGLPITAALHNWYLSRGDCDQDRPN